MRYDTIIVGGGSAGCVMAHRLSEKSSRNVLLCEAGRDLVEGQVPDDIRASYPGTAYVNKNYIWPTLKVRSIGGGHNRGPGDAIERPYVQARILGGGSSINGQMANWGVPSDYEDWVSLGASGWGWENVFPYFRKVERDVDFATPNHGQAGRIAVRRIFPNNWGAHARATAAAFEEMGYRYLADQNGDFGDGYFPIVHANIDEQRVSAATAYLDATTRHRPNLTVMTDSQVVGLRFDGRRCIGITVMSQGRERNIDARQVVLCAGALHSPAILLRAGIGPGSQLVNAGVEVIADRPGVGQGLMDHPQVALGAYLKPSARMDASTGRHFLVGLRYSSGVEGAPAGDMFAGNLGRTAWHDVGKQLGSLAVWVNKTFSRDGQVRIVSKDWRIQPDIDFRLLSDPRDMERLVSGLRMLGACHLSGAMKAITTDPFPASYTDRARQVGTVNRKNRFLTTVMAHLLDGPAPLRRALLKGFIMSGHDFVEVMQDDDAARAFVTEAVAGIWHASCSCRMGAETDPMAVTDPQGRVRGVTGLRIADASIFPSIPSANTNFPVYMTAEKIAAAIDAEGD